MARIFLQSSLLADMVVLSVDENLSDAEIKQRCIQALPTEFQSDELVLTEEERYSEGKAEDFSEGLTASKKDSSKSRSKRYHIGRCKKVTVKVRYAGQTHERSFSPAATVEQVKVWALHAFHVASSDAAELTLQLIGSETQPSRDVHVGALADTHCNVGFDLVRSYTVNGDSLLSPDHEALEKFFMSAAYLSGEEDGRWALRAIEWPFVFVDVFAVSGDCYTLRLQCDGYPMTPPTGAFWDNEKGTFLMAGLWPRVGAQRGQSFRTDWQNGTALYIPCDRHGIAGHDQWNQIYPAWVWAPNVGLTRYLNVVSELLNGADYAGPQA
ncbi:DUF7665 family protein [Rhodoferax mekongensis]|uniref:Uncharacterized protein n=1 Tax=Rhodoferax mekongensis TaxID=3068341 RepID=A0ABZ0AWK5_9BURK|nr:hypothetical protein [Rhodoferax sp. TBRC 17307]WNO03998.1 hypothetical protein RAN89_13910 [Rhodoferax sp. TBRC 17307]